MSEKDRNLLLRDLCTRLPYDLFINDGSDKPIHIYYNDVHFENYFINILNGNIKPYLRSMSSMTEEERNEYFSVKMIETERVALAEIYRPEAISEIIDWLNSRHFDYRGLIEKGLAIEATNDIYKD